MDKIEVHGGGKWNGAIITIQIMKKEFGEIERKREKCFWEVLLGYSREWVSEWKPFCQQDNHHVSEWKESLWKPTHILSHPIKEKNINKQN